MNETSKSSFQYLVFFVLEHHFFASLYIASYTQVKVFLGIKNFQTLKNSSSNHFFLFKVFSINKHHLIFKHSHTSFINISRDDDVCADDDEGKKKLLIIIIRFNNFKFFQQWKCKQKISQHQNNINWVHELYFVFVFQCHLIAIDWSIQCPKKSNRHSKKNKKNHVKIKKKSFNASTLWWFLFCLPFFHASKTLFTCAEVKNFNFNKNLS
jgi:hypothetical protein